MKKSSLLLLLLIPSVGVPFFASCKRSGGTGARTGSSPAGASILITSKNEPHNDADAYALAGIKITPEPKLEMLHFTAGMDDQMELVFRFPKNQLDDFYRDNGIDPKDTLSSRTATPSQLESLNQDVSSLKVQPSFDFIKKSTDGIWYEKPSDGRTSLRFYLAMDQDPDNVLVYAGWFEL